MKVHYHPDLRSKNLKEYVLEGLMIFMAVTLGFFAEKLREKITENSREKGFIVSMIEDARTDIVNIDECIALNTIRVMKLDTLANRCFNYGSQGDPDGSLYDVVIACIRHPEFLSQVERTMIQLKNAGNMRLIDSPVAVGSIISYDQVMRKLVNQQDYYELHLKVLLDATEKLFNLKHYPLNPNTMKWESRTEDIARATLIDHDRQNILEFGNKAKIFQGIVMFYIVRLGESKTQAIQLIQTLKKEYDIH